MSRAGPSRDGGAAASSKSLSAGPRGVLGMARRVRTIHMVGVGGAGMSGIAEVLVNLGYTVRGSDVRSSEVTAHLAECGVDIRLGHAATHVDGVDVVVVSSAIRSDNEEVKAARHRRIPVIRRAEMLAELMRACFGIAVAGSHGKTTTTSMVGSILAEAGLEPTVVVGGKLNAVGSNAQLGAGPYMVVEADESDGSFLHLSPTVAVLTNIDPEHLDHYAGDFGQLKAAFRDFLGRLPFYGLSVACGDHPEVKALLRGLDRRVVTYGLSEGVDLRASDLRQSVDGTEFSVSGPKGPRGAYRVAMLGAHNVQNALAALAVADELGVSPEVARLGLAGFAGVDRRFSRRGEVGGILVVDDYGHHPVEIAATLAGARCGYPGRRIVAVFQPHRYTRTASLLGEFGGAFADAEVVFVLPVYGAGEAPIEGVDALSVVSSLRKAGHPDSRLLSGLQGAADLLLPELRSGDIVIAFGAGDVGRLGRALVETLTLSKMTDGS